MNNNFIVYFHYTQDTNELFYVGEGRPNRCFDKRHRNRYWNFKVNKHGGFYPIIVYSDLTKNEAQEIEANLILKLRNDGAKLCNFCVGHPFKNSWLVGAPKELHPMYGKRHPNPKLAQWNRDHSGEKSPTFGKKRPDLSERNKLKKNKPRVKPIICNETGKKYSSVKEASIEFKTTTGITKVLTGCRKHFKGFTFSYL